MQLRMANDECSLLFTVPGNLCVPRVRGAAIKMMDGKRETINLKRETQKTSNSKLLTINNHKPSYLTVPNQIRFYESRQSFTTPVGLLHF